MHTMSLPPTPNSKYPSPTNPTPTPTPKEPKEGDQMKRSIQPSSPDSITSKRKDENVTKAQTNGKAQSSLSTEKYWAEKAGNLQNAFVEGGVMDQAQCLCKIKGEMDVRGAGGKGLGVSKPRPAALDLSKTRQAPDATQIQTQSPDIKNKKNPEYNNTIKSPALSGTAIVSILQQTKLDCPKAQAWIKAQQTSEKTKAHLALKLLAKEKESAERVDVKMKMKEHAVMERIVASKLADKAREMWLGSSEVAGRDQDAGKTEDKEKEWEERNMTPQQRVHRARDRLQKALGLE